MHTNPRDQHDDRPDSSIVPKLAITIFLLLFIAGGVSFAVLSGGLGAPLIFPIFGIGFAVLGGLLLFTALTRKTRGMPRIDPDSPIVDPSKRREAASSAKCPGCGARRRSNDVFCQYCGAALT